MAPYHRTCVRVVSTLLATPLCLAGAPAGSSAQDATTRWRAVWIDTFNTRLTSPASRLPAQGDARWSPWRREQLPTLTRRLTVASHARRPALVIPQAGPSLDVVRARGVGRIPLVRDAGRAGVAAGR